MEGQRAEPAGTARHTPKGDGADRGSVPARAANRVRSLWNGPEKWLLRAGLKSAPDLPLPDFLGLGGQRCGSTWLYANLRAHPDVFLPDERFAHPGTRTEVHYFDRNYHQSVRWYARCFAEGQDKLKGDITPAYGIVSPARVRFVRALLPQAKLLFVMRDPVERAWSHARLTLVREAGRDPASVTEAEYLAHFRSPEARARGDYVGIVSRWLEAFPREQLFLGSFHRIARDPRGLLEEILRFLGASCDVDWSALPYDREINRGPELAIPPRYREFLEEMYREPRREIASRYGIDFGASPD